jgi:hypothetical protein
VGGVEKKDRGVAQEVQVTLSLSLPSHFLSLSGPLAVGKHSLVAECMYV